MTTPPPAKPRRQVGRHRSSDGPVRGRSDAESPSITETRGESILRVRLGTALQRHRLRRGLTQAQLAELADLSLKYVGEIERGDANTTLEALERLAHAVEWDPMEALDTVHEPISEGVRVLLIGEVSRAIDRGKMMLQWLNALDPVFIATARERGELTKHPDSTSRPKIGRRRRDTTPATLTPSGHAHGAGP